MYVFHYDPVTFEYTGASPVDFCQLEPGNVLLPAWASKNPPPSGWDSRIERPFYVPAKDAWHVRPLPAPPAAESVPEPQPVEAAADLDATIKAHLRAAQELMAQLKERAE